MNRASDSWVCPAVQAHAARIRAISAMNSTSGSPSATGRDGCDCSGIRRSAALLGLGQRGQVGVVLLLALRRDRGSGQVADRHRKLVGRGDPTLVVEGREPRIALYVDPGRPLLVVLAADAMHDLDGARNQGPVLEDRTQRRGNLLELGGGAGSGLLDLFGDRKRVV